MPGLTIIIPAYNESTTIIRVLDAVTNETLIGQLDKEIIVVNDGSADDTEAQILNYIQSHSQWSIRCVTHPKNRGKGAAIRTGIESATRDYVLIQDADLEYDPVEYNSLLKPLVDNRADVVFGSRFMGGKPHRILFFWHSIGNKFLTMLSNIVNDLNLTDMETGYKCFRRSIIQQVLLKENRFGFEPEVTAKIARFEGIRIYEVGIAYYGRTYKEGKKINWKDGVRAIYAIMWYGFFDRTYRKPGQTSKF